MPHPLTEQLVEMLEQIKEIDFAETSAVKFMASLRDKLVATGFSRDDAETIVSVMEIDIPPDALDAGDVELLSTAYCEIINKVHQALVDNGFQKPVPALLKICEKFSLNLS